MGNHRRTLTNHFQPCKLTFNPKRTVWQVITITSWLAIIFVTRLFTSLYQCLFVNRKPSRDDVSKLVRQTLLCTLVERKPDGLLMLNVTDCRLRLLNPDFHLRSFSITFTDDNQLVEFVLNGEQVHDETVMYSTIMVYMTFCSHATIHTMSARLIEIVRRERIALLNDCTYFTEELHDSLLNSWWTPVWKGSPNLIFNNCLNKCAFLEESLNWTDITHVGLDTFSDCPNIRLLHKARAVVKEELQNQLGYEKARQLTELVFVCVVLHNMDHLMIRDSARGIRWTYNILGVDSFWQAFRAEYFTQRLVDAALSPLNSNLIKDKKSNPFFSRLYERLKSLDCPYVDSLTASIMY